MVGSQSGININGMFPIKVNKVWEWWAIVMPVLRRLRQEAHGVRPD
jgi:hypothetical protein